MKRIYVRIVIISNDIDFKNLHYEGSLNGWTPETIYKSLSNSTQIKVNNTPDKPGYTIIYLDDVFDNLDPKTLAYNVNKLFNDNLQPEEKATISIDYIYDDPIDRDEIYNIIQLEECFRTFEDSGGCLYERSNIFKKIFFNEDEDDDEEDEEDEDSGYFGILDSDDEYDGSDIINDIDEIFGDNKKKIMKKSYGTSRIMKSERDAKRNVKKHGIIISSDKNAKKKDEKILKNFLKDFIPGDSKWVKEYRLEILSRWMDMYVMPKKIAKKIAKEYKNQNNTSKGQQSRDAIVGLTQKILQNYDPFYDPNR